MEFKKFIKKIIKKWYVWTILIFLLLFPLVMNFIFFSWRTTFTFGELDTWIGFFATYYGAIIGGVISGGLTLLGVKLTIDQQTKFFERQEEIYAKDKYNSAQYIKSEIHHRVISVESSIKSISENDYEDSLQAVYKCADELDKAASELFSQASNVDETILYAMKSLAWAAQDIKEFIDESIEKDFELDHIINNLLNGRYYQRLAIADNQFIDSIRSIKLKQEALS